MPTYVYQCDKCGLQFERRQRVTEDPLKDCPECEGQVHRVFQPVGIVFKGSGWYCTDNRAKSPTAVPGESKSGGNGHKADDKAGKVEQTEKTSSSAPAGDKD